MRVTETGRAGRDRCGDALAFPRLNAPVMIRSQRLLERAEWTIAFLLSALAIFLLVVRATHAGALWRDECAVVQLAAMPAVSDIFHNFQHEAFPPLFPLIVRGYMIVFGSNDNALRVFGFCIGCLLVAAFWINARLVRRDVPLVALALISLNTTFFVWGTTIRGYGLGSTLIILIFAFIGSLLVKPTRRRIMIAALVACFGLQILLYNNVLLVAIGGAAIAILLLQKKVKHALLIAVICSLALVSLVPYLPAYLRARDWSILIREWPTSYSLWKHFELALGNPDYSISALWYTITVGLTGMFTLRLFRNRAGKRDRETRLIWFAILASVMGLIGCYAFLRILGYPTSNWYYLAFICMVAAALDVTASILCRSNWLRFCRLGVATTVLFIAPVADWSAITERQTNVDFAAQAVTRLAARNDLVVVVPWQFGIPFNRYYYGSARWTTIPNIGNHTVHRYDLLRQKMISPHPIGDVLEEIQQSLAAGNRVWFVGGLNQPQKNRTPAFLSPAPDPISGWNNLAYSRSWLQQLGDFVRAHSERGQSVSLPSTSPVNEFENVPLMVVNGWQ
jgi:hypothetical protein